MTQAIINLLVWQAVNPRKRGATITPHDSVWYVDLIDDGRLSGAANESLEKAIEEALRRIHV